MISGSQVQENRRYSKFLYILMEAAAICLVGAALGLLVNYPLILENFQGGGGSHVVRNGVLPLPVEMQDVIKLIEGGAVPVDARSREMFEKGHLPGARSLPVGEVDSALGLFAQNVSLESMIIVYCSGYGCPDSEDVATRLMSAGFSNVMVYEGGFPEWRDSGLPMETGGTP